MSPEKAKGTRFDPEVFKQNRFSRLFSLLERRDELFAKSPNDQGLNLLSRGIFTATRDLVEYCNVPQQELSGLMKQREEAKKSGIIFIPPGSEVKPKLSATSKAA